MRAVGSLNKLLLPSACQLLRRSPTGQATQQLFAASGAYASHFSRRSIDTVADQRPEATCRFAWGQGSHQGSFAHQSLLPKQSHQAVALNVPSALSNVGTFEAELACQEDEQFSCLLYQLSVATCSNLSLLSLLFSFSMHHIHVAMEPGVACPACVQPLPEARIGARLGSFPGHSRHYGLAGFSTMSKSTLSA
jgi:hypothetical protein